MPTQTTYHSSTYVPLAITWRCSHCGNLNTVQFEHEISRSTTSGGSASHSGASVNATMTNLDALRFRSDMSKELIGVPLPFNTYIKYHFPSIEGCSCKKCSRHEPWRGRNLRGLTFFTGLIGAILFLYGFLLLIDGVPDPNQLKLFLIGGVTLFLSIFLTILYKNHRTKQIAALPKTSLPILVKDGRPVINMDVVPGTNITKS